MIEGDGLLSGRATASCSPAVRGSGRSPGIARDDLAPSRRYYAGGGGSVRGFGYQGLGPARSQSAIRSAGAASTSSRSRRAIASAISASCRSSMPASAMKAPCPRASDMRFGAGIGGRFYTNFGPLRDRRGDADQPAQGRSKDRALRLDRAGVLMADDDAPTIRRTVVIVRRAAVAAIVQMARHRDRSASLLLVRWSCSGSTPSRGTASSPTRSPATRSRTG